MQLTWQRAKGREIARRILPLVVQVTTNHRRDDLGRRSRSLADDLEMQVRSRQKFSWSGYKTLAGLAKPR